MLLVVEQVGREPLCTDNIKCIVGEYSNYPKCAQAGCRLWNIYFFVKLILAIEACVATCRYSRDYSFTLLYTRRSPIVWLKCLVKTQVSCELSS